MMEIHVNQCLKKEKKEKYIFFLETRIHLYIFIWTFASVMLVYARQDKDNEAIQVKS